MSLGIRWSEPLAYVLALLANRASNWVHGYEISKLAAIGPGTLYPLLARLEERRWVQSRWDEPTAPGRPPRRAYHLTNAGRTAAARILSEKRSLNIVLEVRTWT